jgi:16S rRNA pseudouridine516 synthase
MEVGSRSQVKEYIRKGQVTVNDVVCKKPETKLKEDTDRVCLLGKEIAYQSFVYYLLNKPAGVVSATTDQKEKTVLDLLKDAPGKDLFPVGRLDKDTLGLLLITNDGELAHHLLSPRKHIPKTYLVNTRYPLDESAVIRLTEGVDIGEDHPTLPAKVEILDANRIKLTITEGKFHQVKRMLRAVDNEVMGLKRLSMGSLTLDEELIPGEYRPLTREEIEKLKE